MPPKKKPVKKIVGYEKAEFINAGTVVKDARKREFVVGAPVGQGGFGMIYLSDEKGHSNDMDNARYVIKIEPKANGPLFQEINFYNRHCKAQDIDTFTKANKLSFLGIPKFMSSGIHEYNGNDLRYLIMPRFGRDLQKIFTENGKFNRELTAQIAVKVLYAIEYMHKKRYAHADIKGANILLGNEATSNKEELFLIDFGLAYLLPAKPIHRPDPKAKHDGTIEYCSTDAHDGCKPSFRGDIEILCWCLAHWASGSLPWEKYVKEGMPDAQKENVANGKRRALENPKAFCEDLGIANMKEITDLLKYVTSLDYPDEIDFKKCRAFFTTHLPKTSKLAFTKVASRKSFVSVKAKRSKITRNIDVDLGDNKLTPSTPVKGRGSKRAKEASSAESLETTLAKPKTKRINRTVVKEVEKKTPAKSRATRSAPKPIVKKYVSTDEDEIDETPEHETPSTTLIRSTRSSRRTRQESGVVEEDSEISMRVPKKSFAHISKANQSIDEDSDEEIENIPPLIVEDEPKSKKTLMIFGGISSEETTTTESTESEIKSESPVKTENCIKEDSSPRKSLRISSQLPPVVSKPRKKRMLQPGRNTNPRENFSQTVRSWMSRPEKRQKLRQFLRGERETWQ